MRTSNKTLVLQDLDRLFRRGIAASEDGALIDSFLADGNELAFEALVARHGPMVRGVCKRLLVNPHDADDAFQATFLVLVRKAKQLRDPSRLGPWLYGVARRVATKARTRSTRHRHEPPVDVCSREESRIEWLDVMPILDAELGRLPDKHRDVLILCLLNGASAEEAASQLGCPVGTVKSRLARAREALRDRLTIRGIAPAVALAVLSSAEAFASPVSPNLTRATLELLVSSSIAPGITALTKGVLANMLPKSIVISSLLLGGVAVAGLGTARWLSPSQAQEPQTGVESRGQAPGGGGPQEVRTNHMKQILLAFHNYISNSGHLPPLANFGSDGLPKLSWRVALLPYLEENELYKRFRQDEPWDSPHNKDLIDRMPAVFQTPDSPAPAGQTRIRGFAGRGALFEGTRGIGLDEVTDGTSNTVLIILARDAVPWTQPGELPFVAGQPLPALDSSDPRGYTLGLCDGSVRMLPRSEERLLDMIITRAGGEVILWPEVEGHATTNTAVTTVTPVPTTPPVGSFLPPRTTAAASPPMGAGNVMMGAGNVMSSMPRPTSPLAAELQQRLQRVEEKLDRVLEKLDRLTSGDHPSQR